MCRKERRSDCDEESKEKCETMEENKNSRGDVMMIDEQNVWKKGIGA